MATQPVQRAQVENLYVEAMLLADEAHAAFRAHRDFEAVARDPILQVGMACESLKTTTRLMHIIAWLLHRRAMFAGDPGAGPEDSAAHIGAPVPPTMRCARILTIISRGSSRRASACSTVSRGSRRDGPPTKRRGRCRRCLPNSKQGFDRTGPDQALTRR